MHAHLDRWLTPDLRVRGWRSTDPATTHYGLGAHEAVEVAICLEGGLTYRVGTRTQAVRPGEAIVLPTGFEHRTSIAPNTRARSFWIAAPIANEIQTDLDRRFDDLALRPSTPLLRFADPLFDEAMSEEPGADHLGDLLARALLVDLLRGAPREDPIDPRIRRALQRIDRDFAEPLTIDDLATTAGLSRFHFMRQFKTATGVSPYRYLIDRRIDAAARRLESRAASVTEVAFDVGFTDLSGFARAFRRKMGATPSSYAARLAS